MSSLFLAAKVEEHQRKLRDFLHMFNHIYHKRRDEPESPLKIGGSVCLIFVLSLFYNFFFVGLYFEG